MTGRGILIGELFGIPIRIDYSWFLILILLTVVLSARFGQSFPYLGVPARVSLALSGSLLLFGSVLAHELSHAVVALRNGVGIRGITLFVFGGAAEMIEEPPTPGSELKIAAAGPVMSLFLALFFYAFYQATLGSLPLPFVELAGLLAQMNLVLLAFNVVPGFPLDGGRVLRALLWGIWQSPAAATRVAAGLGSFFGTFVMFLGLLWILSYDPIGGLWFILIGFFLRRAASATFQQMLVRRALEGVRARDVMSRQTLVVPPDMTLADAVERVILPGGVSELPVVEDGRFLGVLRLKNIRGRESSAWPHLTARDLIAPGDSSDVIAPDDEAIKVLALLGAEDRLLPVVEAGEFLGVVSRGELLRRLQIRMELGER